MKLLKIGDVFFIFTHNPQIPNKGIIYSYEIFNIKANDECLLNIIQTLYLETDENNKFYVKHSEITPPHSEMYSIKGKKEGHNITTGEFNNLNIEFINDNGSTCWIPAFSLDNIYPSDVGFIRDVYNEEDYIIKFYTKTINELKIEFVNENGNTCWI